MHEEAVKALVELTHSGWMIDMVLIDHELAEHEVLFIQPGELRAFIYWWCNNEEDELAGWNVCNPKDSKLHLSYAVYAGYVFQGGDPPRFT